MAGGRADSSLLDLVYRTKVTEGGSDNSQEPVRNPIAGFRKSQPQPGEVATVRAMPTVFVYRGFRFFFYSNEGTPREPLHIHVEKDDMEAKFWLEPEVRVAYNDGYDARALRELLEIVEINKDRIQRAWDEFFG
jgi:hypothetical protein